MYQAERRHYAHFCQFPTIRKSALPFRSLLHKEGLSPGTVKNYFSAVHHILISLGLGDPRVGEMPQLENVIKEIKRRAKGGMCTRLPITPEHLLALKKVW